MSDLNIPPNDDVAENEIPSLPAGPPRGEGQEAQGKVQRFPVLEVFGPTLQGEGLMIGVQTMFIRLGGCDYRCTMCDSLHAVLPHLIKENARRLTAQEVVKEVVDKSRFCRVVTISGGNPCMWDITEIVKELCRRGYQIAVETQGTIFQDWLAYCKWITVSPKGPGMGEKFEADKFMAFGQQLASLPAKTSRQEIAIKIVIFDQRDIEFAKEVKLLSGMPLWLSLGNPYPPQPQDTGKNRFAPPEEDLPKVLLRRMLVLWEDIVNEPELADAKFLPQMHVLLWHNEQGR